MPVDPAQELLSWPLLCEAELPLVRAPGRAGESSWKDERSGEASCFQQTAFLEDSLVVTMAIPETKLRES